MSDLHSTSNLIPFSPTPIRTYARDAVAAVQIDQRQGVLAWRIAEYLLQQIRGRDRRAMVRLDQVQPNEREYYLRLAFTALGMGDAIDSSTPPTAFEIRRYEQRKALALARARARHEAQRQRHELEVWRPEPSRPSYEQAFCRHCRAGATIHVETAEIFVSAPLQAPCPSR